jgi:hypothetical protein
MLDRIQPGIDFLHLCHAIRKPNRVIFCLELRTDMDRYGKLRVSARRSVKRKSVQSVRNPEWLHTMRSDRSALQAKWRSKGHRFPQVDVEDSLCQLLRVDLHQVVLVGPCPDTALPIPCKRNHGALLHGTTLLYVLRQCLFTAQ